MRQLKGCPDSNASTAWDHPASFIVYSLGWRDRWMPAQNAATILKLLVPNPPVNPFHTWCNMLLTGLHHSPVVSLTLLLLPSNTSIIPSLTCMRVRGNHNNNNALGAIGSLVRLLQWTRTAQSQSMQQTFVHSENWHNLTLHCKTNGVLSLYLHHKLCDTCLRFLFIFNFVQIKYFCFLN